MATRSIETISDKQLPYLTDEDMVSMEDEIAMKVDVQRVVASLPPYLQTICHLLSLGKSKTEIAKELGKSRAALEKDLDKIRGVFSQYRLDVYLKD